MEIDDEDLKIKVKLSKKSGDLILAKVKVIIKTTQYGLLTLKGFLVWKSTFIHPSFQELINITAPTKYVYGHYLPTAFFEDPKAWAKLQDRIYDAYRIALSRQSKEDESIDPDSVRI